MRVHVSWLEEMVETPPRAELARLLGAAGVEVEGIDDPRSRCRGVKVARITEVAPHPDAQNLSVCTVDDGQALHTVVCGARNVVCDAHVAYAPVGARLGSIEIAAKTLRGVQSAGMLCSREELGLAAEEDGICILPSALAPGADIGLAMGLTDVFDLSITPNRPDLLSHLGIAREVAAGSGRRLKASKWRVIEKGPEIGTLARAIVEDNTGCRRYVGRVLRGIQIGPSPLWLRERLHAIGQRPINNVVDVTNYVMQEMGAPLHAFDLQALQIDMGMPTVRVRRAHAGEALTTLDGVERTLDADDLVVADGNGPVALAGIMGGQNSQVRPETTQILLEGAIFDAGSVRRTARRQGLRTEASLRFERGVDAGVVARAVDRCAQLLAEMMPAEIAKGSLDVQQKSEPSREVLLRFSRVERILGMPFAPEAIVALLEPLEVRCSRRTEAALVFGIPSFRPDLEREIDLIEEIARRHGYDRLPQRLPMPSASLASLSYQPRSGEAARVALLAQGASECVNFAFCRSEALQPFAPLGGTPVELLNPLGTDQRCLRTTLQIGLLASLSRNLRRGQNGARLFEIGTVFWQRPQAEPAKPGAGMEAPQGEDGAPVLSEKDARLAACNAVLPHEEVHIGAVLHGPRHPQRFYDGQARLNFADAKGDLEALLEAYDPAARIVYRDIDTAILNPYARAQVVAERDDAQPVVLGWIGQLDPAYAQTQSLPTDVFALELSLTALQSVPRRRLLAKPLPKFPTTRRDLAVVAPVSLPAEQLRQFVVAHAGGALGPQVVDDVQLFDVYSGKGVADGMVSLAFAIRYMSHERTLTDAEVTPAFLAMLEQLKAAFGVEVRDGSSAA